MNRNILFKVILLFPILLFTSVLPAQENWLVATEDCYVKTDVRDNSGADEVYDDWVLWIRADDNIKRDAYLKFSLDNTNYLFPDDIKLAFVKLTLNGLYNHNESLGRYANFSVYDAGNSSWSEETMTWNTVPWNKQNPGEAAWTLHDTLAPIHPVNDPSPPLVMNLTSFVRDQLTAGNFTFSVVLSDTTYGTTSDNGTDIRIYSKDCLDPVKGDGARKDPDSTYFPYLVINENPMWVGYDQVPVKEDCYIEKRADNESDTAQDEPHNTWRIWVRSDDDKHARMSYLKFAMDESPYLFSDQIGKVYLSLMIDRLYNYGGFYSKFAVYDVGNSDWSENTLTWNTAPWKKEDAGEPLATFTEQLEQISSSHPVYPVWFDITDYVKNQLDQGNYTFTLALCDTSYWETWANLSDIRFFSKDAIDNPDAEKDPEITYVPSLFIKGPDETTQVKEKHTNSISTFKLHQNYPNPFNPETNINFEIRQIGYVDIDVYNIAGQKVKDVLYEKKEAGSYTAKWDGTDNFGKQMPSGVYITRLTSGQEVQSIKMLLVR